MLTKVLKKYIKQVSSFLNRLPVLAAWTVGTLFVLAILPDILLVVWFPVQQAIQLFQDGGAVGLPEVIEEVQPVALEALKALLPGVAGIAGFVAANAAIENWRVAQDKQLTDLFVESVKMLADKERLEGRTGAIYALERIAKNSNRDHWTIMEVLTSFLQRDSSGAAFLKIFGTDTGSNKNEADKLEFAQADIQAALTVIGRRAVNKDPSDGRRLSLIKANLSWVHVEYGSDFRRALFMGANLIRTYFPKADFTDALLIRADLRGASLTESDFTDANLQRADLRAAIIKDAILTNADLEGADLRGVIGRKATQIVAAKNWWLAKYDDEFAQELDEFAQKQAEHDPELVEQLRLFEQNRQVQSEEPDDPAETSG